MLKLLYFIILTSLSLQDDSSCPPYQCDSSSSSVSGCVRKDISSMKLTECNEEYECSGQYLEATDYNFGRCNLLEGKNLRSVGDYCYYEANCATSYCLNYACSVKELADSCSSDKQCSTFLKCFQNQCQDKLHVGELCPTNGRILCRKLSQCIKTGDNFDYKCQALFSVAAGQQVTPAINETVDGTICETGEINLTSNTCYPSVNYHSSFPLKCTTDTDCAGSVANSYSSCVCHYINNQGNKYCTPFPSEKGKYLNDSIKKAQSNYSKCAEWQHILGIPTECNADISEDKYIKDWIPTKNWRDSCMSSVNLTKYIYNEIPSLSQCPKFICVSTITKNKTEQEQYILYKNCIEYKSDVNTFYLKECPTGYYCPKSSLYIGNSPQTIACVQNNVHLNPYKEICLRNSECYSQFCNLTDYTCTYKEEFTPCENSFQCCPNCQCFSNSCQKNLEINNSCNSIDYAKCRPLTQCAFLPAIEYFSCQQLYQIKSDVTEFKLMLDGEQVSSQNIPFAYKEIFNSMCISGYFDRISNKCSDQPQKVAAGFPKQCTQDEDCVSSETAEDGNCECYMNVYGYKYCQGFTADQKPNYFTLYHEFTMKNLSNCFYYELVYENIATINKECNVGNFEIVSSVPEVAIGSCYGVVLGGEYMEEEENQDTQGGDINSNSTNSSNSSNQTETKFGCKMDAIFELLLLFIINLVLF